MHFEIPPGIIRLLMTEEVIELEIEVKDLFQDADVHVLNGLDV